jgi:hypothetical protein
MSHLIRDLNAQPKDSLMSHAVLTLALRKTSRPFVLTTQVALAPEAAGY